MQEQLTDWLGATAFSTSDHRCLLATATTASIVRVEIEMDLMLSLNFATDNRQAGDIVTARIPKHCVEEFIL